MTNLYKQHKEKHKLQWIDRYVYAVTKRLPLRLKAEVKQELTSNILDMLDEHANEKQIKELLQSLGSPSKMAYSYVNQDRYLISPSLFYKYWDVLRLVTTIFVIVASVGALIEQVVPILTQPTSFPWFLMILSVIFFVIFKAISAAITSFGVVTLIFALIEYFSDADEISKEWNVNDLPDLPEHYQTHFNKTKEITITIITVVLLSALFIGLRFPESAIYSMGEGVEVFILLPANIETYFWYFMAMIGFYIIVRILFIKQGGYNKFNVTIHTIYQLVFAILIIAFINDPNFLNPDFIQSISTNVGTEIAKLVEILSNAMKIVSVIVVIATAADIINPIRKVISNNKKTTF